MAVPQGWVAPRPPSGPGALTLRPLSVSEILDGAAGGIRMSPRAVVGVSLTLAATLEVAVAIVGFLIRGNGSQSGLTPSSVLDALGGNGLVKAASLLLIAYSALLLAGLLAPAVARSLLDLPSGPRQVWREARPVAWRLVGAALTILVLSLLALTLPGIPLILLLVLNGPAWAGVLSGLLWAVCGIPLMAFVYIRYALALPAIALERAGVGQGLRRSARLVRGRWWRTTAVLSVTVLLTLIMSVMLLVPFVLLYALVVFLLGLVELHVGGLAAPLSVTAGLSVTAAVTGAFDSGVLALLYLDARMRSEGLDLDLQTRPVDSFEDMWAVR